MANSLLREGNEQFYAAVILLGWPGTWPGFGWTGLGKVWVDWAGQVIGWPVIRGSAGRYTHKFGFNGQWGYSGYSGYFTQNGLLQWPQKSDLSGLVA